MTTKTKLTITNPLGSIKGKRGQYPKSNEFYQEIKKWKRLNDCDEDYEIVYMPLEPGLKRPIGYQKLKPQLRNGNQFISQSTHNWQETNALIKQSNIKPIPIETCDSDFAVIISGDLAVLDFDCETDYKWFIDEFKFDVNNYQIDRGKFTKSHGCDCCNENSYGYHIYFKLDTRCSWVKNVKCIWKDDWSDRRRIDFIKETGGTPHIIRCPNGDDGREWVNEVETIDMLPSNVIKHLSDFWYSKKEKDTTILIKDNTNIKLIELLNQLGSGFMFQQRQYNSILSCLRSNGVSYEDVYKWSSKLRQSNSKDNREEHRIYLRKLWVRMENENDFKDHSLIRNIVCNENETGYYKIHNKYLKINERYFSRKRLKDIETSNLSLNDKLNLIKAYYNRFFIYIVDEAPKIYKIQYSVNGTNTIELTMGKPSELAKSYGIETKMSKDSYKPANTFNWWLNQVGSNEYSQIVFEPYGIIDRPEGNYSTYNSFNGYNMKYDDSYSIPEDDELGDNIEKHFREVLTNDDHILLLGLKAWFYKYLIKGQRTNLGLLFYSKLNGAGKSMWIESFMEHVIGEVYSQKTANIKQSIGGNFTIGEDKTILVAEEIPQYRFDGRNGSNEVDCCLKSMITDKMTRSRKMYQNEKMVKSHLSFIGLTNNLRSMNPEMAQRRFMMYILNCKFVGDQDYFDKQAEAMTYNGWRNWVHRYLIDDKQLSKINVMPSTSFLDKYANTDLRKLTLDRGLNSLVYWIRDFLDEIQSLEDDEVCDVDKYKSFIGQHRPINDYNKPGDTDYIPGLFSSYKNFCEENAMYPVCKHSKDFIEALKTTYEISIKNLSVSINEGKPLLKKNSALSVIKVDGKGNGNDGKKYTKKAYRSYVIFDQLLLMKLDTITRDLEKSSVEVCQLSLTEFTNGMKPLLGSEIDYDIPNDF